MKRWWLVGGLLLSLGLNVGILSTLAVQRFSRPEHEVVGGEEDFPFRLPLLADRLRLDGEPRDGFLAAHRQLLMQIAKDRQRVERARRAVRQQLVAPRPEERQLATSVAELSAALAEQEGRMVAHVLAMRRLLGPRQERLYLEALRRWVPETIGPRSPGWSNGRRREAAPPQRPRAPG